MKFVTAKKGKQMQEALYLDAVVVQRERQLGLDALLQRSRREGKRADLVLAAHHLHGV